MKYLLISVLALGIYPVCAQKLMLKPPKVLPFAPQNTPPNTYRFSENSGVIYAQPDNMPILLAQSPENMPNLPLRMRQDTAGVYKMPNPLRREAKPLPQKP